VKSAGEGVTVSILGKEFVVACPENERAALIAAAAYLDKKMREIHASGKVIGTERTAIMAALNIAHELLSTKVGGGFDIAEVKRRMNHMETVLDQAMRDQSKLS